MPSQDHLLLKTVRLQPAEEWAFQGEGVAFVVAQSGVGRHSSTPATRAFVPGDLLVLSGPATGKLMPMNKRDLVLSCFTLCVEHLFPLFDGSEIASLQGVIDGLKGVRFYPASDRAAGETNRLLAQVPPQGDLEHRSQLLRAAAVLLTAEFDKARRQHKPSVAIEERMVQIFETLSNAEILNSSVMDLAARFGCSRRHLDRLFLHHFGISTSALKMEMRLLKAVSLLRNPDAKVINVASDCGFHHLGLFNVRFKRRFGCSPGQWRELAGASQTPPKPPVDHGGSCRLRAIGLCPETFGANKNDLTRTLPVQTHPNRFDHHQDTGASNPGPAKT